MIKGLHKFRKYHVHIFLASFVFQMLLMGIYTFVVPHIPASSMPHLLPDIHRYAGDFILMYQFWFVGGGVLACHYEQIRDWVVKHAKLVMWGVILILFMNVAHYLADLVLLKKSESTAQMVFQPIMLPYCFIVTVALLVAGCAWASRRLDLNWQRFSRFVQLASNTSFGILLIQPILIAFVRGSLTWVDQFGISNWIHYSLWPVSAMMVYFVAMFLSYLVGKMPVLSYVVGRKTEPIR